MISVNSIGRLIARHLKDGHTKRFIKRSIFLSGNRRTDEPTDIPDNYLAAVLKDFNEPLIIERQNTNKSLSDNDILIDVHYCALNPADVLMSKNLYTFTPSLPFVLGYEITGKVVKAGEAAINAGFTKDTDVVALNIDRYGGLAELCIASIDDTWKVPSSAKLLDTAAFFDNYVRALLVIERNASLEDNDILLTNVSLSNIAPAIMDMATNIYLKKVIAVCKSEDIASVMRDKGAYASLKYDKKAVLKTVKLAMMEQDLKESLTGDDEKSIKDILRLFYEKDWDDQPMKGVLNDDKFIRAVYQFSPEGRLVISGNAFDEKHIEKLVQQKNTTVTMLNFKEIRATEPETFRQAGNDVLDFYDESFLAPPVVLLAGLNHLNHAIKIAFEAKSPMKVIMDLKNKDTVPQIVECLPEI